MAVIQLAVSEKNTGSTLSLTALEPALKIHERTVFSCALADRPMVSVGVVWNDEANSGAISARDISSQNISAQNTSAQNI